MSTTELNTRWKQLVLVPAATASLLLLTACGSSESEAPDAPETEAEDDAAAGESADGALTMEDVEQNDSPDSCWAVMNGTVYDLTDWIDQHPGGADRIEGLCGTDAADAFAAQHGGQDGPEGQLAEFEIGELED